MAQTKNYEEQMDRINKEYLNMRSRTKSTQLLYDTVQDNLAKYYELTSKHGFYYMGKNVRIKADETLEFALDAAGEMIDIWLGRDQDLDSPQCIYELEKMDTFLEDIMMAYRGLE